MHSVRSKITVICNKILENASNDRSSFLRNISTIGWGLSCAAQVFSIAINDKIPKKEKKFMIPQELVDGLVNMILFWTLTSKAKDWGQMQVLKGKIIPASMKSVFDPKKPFTGTMKEIRSKIINKLKNMRLPSDMQADLKSFDEFTTGISILTGLVGSIVACNIVTPIVRNKLASIYQRFYMKKNEPEGRNLTYPDFDLKTFETKFEKTTNKSTNTTFNKPANYYSNIYNGSSSIKI